MKEHWVEMLLTLVLLILLGFVIFQTLIHNDSLAGKGMDFVYGDLGALWGLTQRKTPAGEPPASQP